MISCVHKLTGRALTAAVRLDGAAAVGILDGGPTQQKAGKGLCRGVFADTVRTAEQIGVRDSPFRIGLLEGCYGFILTVNVPHLHQNQFRSSKSAAIF